MPGSKDESAVRRAVTAAIRRRAHEIWEAEGKPEGKDEEHWARARAEIERAFRRHTAKAGDYEHRWNPPLEIQEALTPGESREPDGLKWAKSQRPKS
ncbi:MAG: DUF2934 domain-containing protein [Magnetospirillum sp.]|nr:DUF2934 domain-containing protein [Magnetospirillum sp.]